MKDNGKLNEKNEIIKYNLRKYETGNTVGRNISTTASIAVKSNSVSQINLNSADDSERKSIANFEQ